MSRTPKPIAVVVGFIVKLPLAGMSLFCLHYVRGLIELGYDVYYVERQNYPGQCYDPPTDSATDSPTYGRRYLDAVTKWIGLPAGRTAFVDLDEECHGLTRSQLRRVLQQSEFVLAAADATWFDELAHCPNRIFVDGDPFFTQHAIVEGNGEFAELVRRYNHLFTFGVRMNEPDCLIPVTGDLWSPTRPVVATSLWTVAPAPPRGPLTAVMNWRSGGDIVIDGRRFGYKGPEFRRFIDIPARITRRAVVALGGSEAPREEIATAGWELADPLEVTETIQTYQAFIRSSWADLGVAKEAYVRSRSGWFSDRSTCYLATGRPVLHQDTGFGDWLHCSDGILSFSDRDSLLDAIAALDRDYAHHASAARTVAKTEFEASIVLDQLLKVAGCR